MQYGYKLQYERMITGFYMSRMQLYGNDTRRSAPSSAHFTNATY